MKPKYQVVADTLRHEIASGIYRDGDALLTELELKDKYGISRQTVRQAIALLEDDGLVMRRRGSGTYVMHGPRKRSGVINVGVITTYITDYIFPSIVRGIESVLSNENCVMNLSATYNRTDRESALLSRVLETPIDGLIIEGTKTALPNPNIALYKQLHAHNIPFVLINGYYPQLQNHIHVVTDDEGGGRLAANTLIAHGHQRIAGIFKSDDMQGHLRYQGYAAALQAAGLPANDENICWFTTENKQHFLSEEIGLAFLQRIKQNADAIVCYNDDIALQLMAQLAKMNISIPDDLSIVSFDNSAFASICHPTLSTLSHPKDLFGRTAAQKLLRMIAGEHEASAVLPWELVERESIRTQK